MLASSGSDLSIIALLHFDGSDGQTTTIDSSSYGNDVTFFGAAELTNNEAKFGATSFNGDLTNDDYAEIAYDPAMEMGTGDWTIEFWAYPVGSAIGGHDYFMHAGQVSNTNRWWISNNNNTFSLNYSSNGGTGINVFRAFGSITANQWNFLSITRLGDNLFAHVGGIKSGATYDVTGLDMGASVPRNIRIGARDNGASPPVAGADAYLDDFRLTVGQARYTEANYTVPDKAF